MLPAGFYIHTHVAYGQVELTQFDTSLGRDQKQLLPLIWDAQYMVRTLFSSCVLFGVYYTERK